MAQYATLKATIDAYIRQNGVKAITGPVLNGVLNAMVESLGSGYLFEGEALPNGDPGTPDQNVVRYATQAGTYTNYGGYVHDGKHLVWFVWHGSWYAYPTQVPTDAALVNAITTAVADFYTKAQTDTLLAGKQATLESGTNIKTINGESILGHGDITIQGGGSEPYFIRGTIDFNQDPPAVTITSGTYAGALAAYNAGTPVYAALTEGNGAVNIYPLAQVISPFLVFLGIGADSVLAVGLQSDGTVTAFKSALVHPSDLAPVATSGNYNDLENKPTIPAAQVNADWNAVSGVAQILNKPTIPAAQVQSDWNEADNTDPSFIKNKPAIPSAPGTLNTDNATAQTVNASEALSGSVKLHKVSKTGSYSDLLNTPTIPTVPTISTDLAADKASNDKTSSPKSVYDGVFPAVQTSQPAGGFAPNILYNIGTLAGDTTFALASPADANIVNHYYWTFDTPATAPTITWPTGLMWMGGSAPTINASKHYEISVLNGIGVAMEV